MSAVPAAFGDLQSLDSFDEEILYKASFGNLPNKTVIYDPWRPQIPGNQKSGPYNILFERGHRALGGASLNKWHQSNLSKAFTFGSQANTLLPVYVDPDIIRVLYERTPFLSLCRRVTNRGRTADWNQITALSNAVWRPEDAALPDQDETYVRQTKDVKFAYAVGRLTGPAAAAMREYADAASLEVMNKTISLRLKEEETLIRGEALAAASDADVYVANEYGPDGLIKSITTNSTDLTGGDITSAALRTAIRSAREAGGNPNLILMQSETLQTFKESLTTQVIFGTQYIGTLQFGMQSLVFDGIPVLEMAIHMPTVADKKVVLVLDMSTIEIRTLLDASMEELAKTNDSDKFMVKSYTVPIVKAESFNAKIVNVD